MYYRHNIMYNYIYAGLFFPLISVLGAILYLKQNLTFHIFHLTRAVKQLQPQQKKAYYFIK